MMESLYRDQNFGEATSYWEKAVCQAQPRVFPNWWSITVRKKSREMKVWSPDAALVKTAIRRFAKWGARLHFIFDSSLPRPLSYGQIFDLQWSHILRVLGMITIAYFSGKEIVIRIITSKQVDSCFSSGTPVKKQTCSRCRDGAEILHLLFQQKRK